MPMDECARHKVYLSPFTARYCSPEFSFLFSAQWKAATYRKLWLALAKAQKKLGLPITDGQIHQMEAHLEKIDFELIKRYEKQFRHDIMAHIHAFGDACPDAKKIIHLGATSTFVTDNGDLIQMREALSLLKNKVLHIVTLLRNLAHAHQSDPCLGFTHYQPAQPTTIGKRICLWLQDFLLDAQDLQRLHAELPFLGVKGATGTQSSFLSLFEQDHKKVEQLEREIAKTFQFHQTLPISGQTYTRKIDLNVLNAIESFSASAHKCATDIRLLAHDDEAQEPFGNSQIGSSAMPYKKNPIYCERICGLARFAISLSQNPAYTASTQWLERSLDDSSNRRLAIPEAFLAADAILNLLSHVFSNLHINAQRSLQHLEQQLPLLCMENILMEAVKKGADRQKLHETLRVLALNSTATKTPLETFIHSLQTNPSFPLSKSEIESLAQIRHLIGRAPQQVGEFLQDHVDPFLKKNPTMEPNVPLIEF